MQYILTEEEFNQGCELIESWRKSDIPLEDVYNESKELNKQGFFTIVNCTNYDKELYEIIVLQKV